MQQLGKHVPAGIKSRSIRRSVGRVILYEARSLTNGESVGLCIHLSLRGKNSVRTFLRQIRILGGVVFYALLVVWRESRWLFLPRTPCFRRILVFGKESSRALNYCSFFRKQQFDLGNSKQSSFAFSRIRSNLPQVRPVSLALHQAERRAPWNVMRISRSTESRIIVQPQIWGFKVRDFEDHCLLGHDAE
jgi:hypothetical protein